MQLFFDKDNMEIIHFGVKIMVCDKKNVKILQKSNFINFVL